VLTGFGRHRQKVSTIAAISVAPGRRRVGLYWKTDPKDYIDAPAWSSSSGACCVTSRGR
jgi:hypothetical protein